MKKSFLAGLLIITLVGAVIGTASITKTAETIPVDPLSIRALK